MLGKPWPSRETGAHSEAPRGFVVEVLDADKHHIGVGCDDFEAAGERVERIKPEPTPAHQNVIRLPVAAPSRLAGADAMSLQYCSPNEASLPSLDDEAFASWPQTLLPGLVSTWTQLYWLGDVIVIIAHNKASRT